MLSMLNRTVKHAALADVEARYLVFGHTDRVAPSLMALRLSETGRFRIRRNRGTTTAD